MRGESVGDVAIMGLIVVGFVADWLIRKYACRRKGREEPDFTCHESQYCEHGKAGYCSRCDSRIW
jgi:hypothetical protein